MQAARTVEIECLCGYRLKESVTRRACFTQQASRFFRNACLGNENEPHFRREMTGWSAFARILLMRFAAMPTCDGLQLLIIQGSLGF